MTRRNQPVQNDRGFSVLEALVALLVAGVILGAAFELLLDDQRAYHQQSQISEMRQSARSVIEFISRDLVSAGFGLEDTAPATNVVIANEPTNLVDASSIAVTVLSNTNDVKQALSTAMTSSTIVPVATSAGFNVGDRCLIWNGDGVSEWFTIASKDATRLVSTTALSTLCATMRFHTGWA